jgi:membrane-associated phospholipid phosphatase
MVRSLVGAAVAAAGFVAVYVLFVRTVAGQRWENAVLAGRSSASGDELRTADMRLDQITVSTLGAAVLLVLAIGFLRHRPLLGLGAAAVVGGSLVLAEVLKRDLLTRPDLVGAPDDIAHNSFPSGHTTIAVSLMVALIMVMPYGVRTWTALAVAAWGVAIAGYTVTAGWHRPSDTIGAALLVLFVACSATAGFSLLGEDRTVAPETGLAAFVRQLPVAPIVLVAAAGLGFGTALGLHSLRLVDGGDTSASTERLCYLAGVALAIGASAGAIIGLLLLLRHIDLGKASD